MDNPSSPFPPSTPPETPTPQFPPVQQTVTPPPTMNIPSQVPPPPPPTQSVVTSMPPTKKPKGFSIFVILSIVVLIAIWAVVGYLYYQNRDIEDSEKQELEDVSPSNAPVSEFSPNEIQISNGNIARVTSFGETQTLIKKEDYPGTGITGFVRVSVSPDNSKICFESIAPAIAPGMYISNVDGSEPFEVEKDRNTCTWSPDSKNVFYINAPLGQQAINIFQYSLETRTEKNLTESKNTETEIRQHTITGTSSDRISCHYDIVDTTGKKLSESTCEIDTQTGEVSDSASNS
jgi:hypothetical protein